MAFSGVQAGAGVPKRRISRQYVSLAGPIAATVPAAPVITPPIYPPLIIKTKLSCQYPQGVHNIFPLPPIIRWDPEYPTIIFKAGNRSWPLFFTTDARLDQVSVPASDFVSNVYPSRIFSVRFDRGLIPFESLYPFPFPNVIANIPVQPPIQIMAEGSSGVYRAILRDELGNLLVPTSIRLSLYVVGLGGVITYVNNRRDQHVLNTNGVTIYSTIQTDILRDGTAIPYNLKWIISPQDTVILNDQLQIERHVALFEWFYSGVKAGKKEIVLGIKNLREV